MKIRTQFVAPPIPSRLFDWQAIDEDTYDGAPDNPSRYQVGYGETEAEAIEDLKAKLEEKFERDDPQFMPRDNEGPL